MNASLGISGPTAHQHLYLTPTMLLDFDRLKDADQELGRGGSSSQYQPGPPPFDADDETALLMPPTEAYEEPPPEFTPYEAKCLITGDGSVVSHDAHLNKDGE